jgi:hypothetical protein
MPPGECGSLSVIGRSASSNFGLLGVLSPGLYYIEGRLSVCLFECRILLGKKKLLESRTNYFYMYDEAWLSFSLVLRWSRAHVSEKG